MNIIMYFIHPYLNMYTGPLLSSVVSATKYDFTARWNNNIIIQYELVTAPGWIMFGLFLFALILVISNFEEPPISHHGRSEKNEKNEKKNETFLDFFMNFFNYFQNFFGSFFEKKDKGVELRGYGSYGTIPVQEEVVRMYVYMYLCCMWYISNIFIFVYVYKWTFVYAYICMFIWPYMNIYIYVYVYVYIRL
jgi:hypothetical protein